TKRSIMHYAMGCTALRRNMLRNRISLKNMRGCSDNLVSDSSKLDYECSFLLKKLIADLQSPLSEINLSILRSFFSQTSSGRAIIFLIKLFAFFLIFDTFFQFLIGASIEGGFYLPILAKFNLTEIYRDFLLQAVGWVISLAGYEYNISDKLLKIDGGSGVIVGY